MKAYQVLIFDLFDTLLRFDRQRLPLAQVDGKEVRTTSLKAYEVVSEAYGRTCPELCRRISFPDFYRAFVFSFEEAARRRSRDFREVPAEERFRILFERLGIKLIPSTSDLLERAILAHMEALAHAMAFPPENQKVLEWAREKYRLGLVSNFDHHPTAYRILEDYGIKGFFDEIVISSEVGFRKPGREIFQIAFDRLGIGPELALFVGDSFEIDVVGAKGVGMDVVWLNQDGKAAQAQGLPQPDFTIANLEELMRLWNGTSSS